MREEDSCFILGHPLRYLASVWVICTKSKGSDSASGDLTYRLLPYSWTISTKSKGSDFSLLVLAQGIFPYPRTISAKSGGCSDFAFLVFAYGTLHDSWTISANCSAVGFSLFQLCSMLDFNSVTFWVVRVPVSKNQVTLCRHTVAKSRYHFLTSGD